MRNHCVTTSGQYLHILRLLGIHGCLAISHVSSREIVNPSRVAYVLKPPDLESGQDPCSADPSPDREARSWRYLPSTRHISHYIDRMAIRMGFPTFYKGLLRVLGPPYFEIQELTKQDVTKSQVVDPLHSTKKSPTRDRIRTSTAIKPIDKISL